MHPDPVATLRRHFGYPGFRPGQEDLVRAVLGGRDALGVLPTGGGKSVCYQVPALILGGLTLVVTPLVSLMEDQVARAIEAGLRAEHLSSAQDAARRRDVTRRVSGGDVDILFVAPERLQSSSFRAFIGGVDVRLLAVDEAHCISEWGHDFRPAYRRIASLRSLMTCPTLALTATATPAVRTDVVKTLELREALVVVRSFDRPNLSWGVQAAGTFEQRCRGTYRLLRSKPGCAVVYAPTRRAVETVRDRLAAWGVRAEAYHAGLAGPERSRVQAAFMAGDCRVVTATNAFGMGIDKADVRTVVHVQLPGTLEAYYQEAGRAGRDGEPAYCHAFFAPHDRELGRRFIDRTHPPPRRLRAAHARLLAVCDSAGIVRLPDATLGDVLGPEADAWIEGEPVGVLGALERVGAIRRIVAAEGPPTVDAIVDSRDRPAAPAGAAAQPPPGSVSPDAVPTDPGSAPPDTVRVGVRLRPDFAAAERLRNRARTKLAAVQTFARTRTCRRAAILAYFGETAAADCGRCDRCLTSGWGARARVRALLRASAVIVRNSHE